MSFLWDGLKGVAGQAGSVVAEASHKTKLKTEIALIDREITGRLQNFGVELYDYVAPLSKHPSFYSSDDTLTVTLQPPLITAQREIAALQIKHGKVQDKMQQAAAKRATTFTAPAVNWQDKLINMGKSTALASSEAVNSTENALINQEMKHHKQQFGINLYQTLEDLEDSKQWLPTDREIRSIYDNCRRDVEKIKKRKHAKELELKVVEGTATAEEAAEVSPDQPAVFSNAYPKANTPHHAVQQPHLGVQAPPPQPTVVSVPPAPGATANIYPPTAPVPVAPAAAVDPFAAAPAVDPFAAPAAPANMFSYPGQPGVEAPIATAPGISSSQGQTPSMYTSSNDPFASLGAQQPSTSVPNGNAMNAMMTQQQPQSMGFNNNMNGMGQSTSTGMMNGGMMAQKTQPQQSFGGMGAMNGTGSAVGTPSPATSDPFSPNHDPFAAPHAPAASTSNAFAPNFAGTTSSYQDPFASLQ